MDNKESKEKGFKVCPCKKLACEMQLCLDKNQWQQEKCVQVLLKLQECCTKNYGDKKSGVSPTCSGFV